MMHGMGGTDPVSRAAAYAPTHALSCILCPGNTDHLAGSHAVPAWRALHRGLDNLPVQ
jgi:hypothetical protein